MGMKAGPASALVVETLGLQGKLTPEKFLSEREKILHQTFSTAQLMPGSPPLLAETFIVARHVMLQYSNSTRIQPSCPQGGAGACNGNGGISV